MFKNPLLYVIATCWLVLSVLNSGCKKLDFKSTTTEDVNIVGYLDKNLDSFSLFRKILDRTETSAFLNAYGSYTCFAPTNGGVNAWLAKKGAASVENADLELLKELVRFHLLTDTITTGAFTDGKLPVPTMQGQFLITGVSSEDGISGYSVNRQARVVKSNVRVGNGIVHEIDRVLEPSTLTIIKQLEADPNFSVFVQAVKETGYYDKLNTIDPDTTKRWLTVMAESNQALADSGIFSYADLKARYSQTGNPSLTNDSLRMYVAYHILPGIKYLGDIIIDASHQTLQPQEVISTQLINNDVVVNEDIFDGVVEKGVRLLRPKSDNSATNGVWHETLAHYTVKFRMPAPVYWDLSTFPEIIKLTAYYKRQNYTFTRQNELDKPIKDIDWEYKGASNFMTYEYTTTGSLAKTAVNNDILTLPLGAPNRATWWEFTTPVIIKGRYKVWFCYRPRNGVTVNIRINGELMQRPVILNQYMPAGSDAELESLGWKRYTAKVDGNFTARLVGTVDIPTTERHKLRIETISGTNAATHVDMVQFIPVDMEQVNPRIDTDGSKVYN